MAYDYGKITGEYGKALDIASRKTGLDKRVIIAAIATESDGRSVVSDKGALGFMQVMPTTAVEIANELGYKDYTDAGDLAEQMMKHPGLNILFGAHYFKKMLGLAGGDYDLAYQFYHDGPNSADAKAGRRSVGPEYLIGANRFRGHLDALGVGGMADQEPQQEAAPTALSRGMAAIEQTWGGRRRAQEPNRDVRRVFGSERNPALYNPAGGGDDTENPVANAYRGFTTTGSLGYYDPMQGEDWGTSPGAVAGRGLGSGAAVAGQFALTGPLVAPLRGAGAMGPMLAQAAQFGGLGAARGLGEGYRENQMAQAAGESTGRSNLEAMLSRAVSAGGQEALVGMALSGLHMIPGVDRIAKGAVSGPLMDVGIVGGMGAGQRVLAGEPVDFGQLALETIPFVAGMRTGNAIAGAAMPRRWSMTAKEKEAEDARIMGEQMALADAAQARQNAMPVPVGKPYSGSIPDYSGSVAAAQASARALPMDAIIERAMNPVTTTRDGKGDSRKQTGFGAPRQPVNWEKAPGLPEPPLMVTPENLPQPTVAKEAPTYPRAWRGQQLRLNPEGAPSGGPILDATGHPVGKPRPPVDITLGSGPGQQLYDWVVRRVSETNTNRRTQRAGRVEAGARKIADALLAGERVPGLENVSQQLGFTFSDPARQPSGASSFDPNTKRWTFSPLPGVRMSVPVADFLNAPGGPGNWLGPIRDFVRTINENPTLLLVDDAVLAQAAKGEIGNVSKAEAGLTDRARIYRRATTNRQQGARYGSAMYDAGLNTGRLLERAREKMDTELGMAHLEVLKAAGIKPNTYEDTAIGRLMMLARDTRTGIPEVAATADGQAILSKSSMPEAVVRAAQGIEANLKVEAQLRNELDRAMDQADIMAGRKTAKQVAEQPREMQVMESYFPRTERRYSRRGINPATGKISPKELWAALEQWSRPERRPIDERRNPRAWSAREQRSGDNPVLRPDQINYSAYDVLTRYTVDTSRMLSNTLALNAGQNVADAISKQADAIRPTDPMRANDLGITADAIRFVTQVAYNGKTRTQLEEWAAATTPGKIVLNAAQTAKMGFNVARYGANLAFMTLTQPTSILMAGAMGRLTPDMIAAALKEYATPRIKAEWENSYTGWVKSKKGGHILNEGQDQGITGDRMHHPLESARMSRGQKFRQKLTAQVEAPVQFIENSVSGRLVYALAEQIGIRAGLEGQRLRDFASDMVGQSQSYYDRVNRARLLSDSFINLAIPAQGFATDVMNTMYDATAKGISGARGDLTATEGAARAAKVMFLMYVMNLLYAGASTTDENRVRGALKDAAPQALGGAVPFLGQAVGWNSQRSGGAQIYPAQLYGDFGRAAEFAAAGDWDRAFSTMANDFLPGGTQLRRMMEAERMIDEGRIPERDRAFAYGWGWARTEAGRRYLREIQEREAERKQARRYR